MKTEIFDQIVETVEALPEFKEWPFLLELLMHGKSADWLMPIIVAEALGAKPEIAVPVGAAIACVQVSIILVDDILDNDPRGAFHKHGVGTIANAALTLQACGHRLLGQSSLSGERLALAHDIYARIATETAFGQKLDADNLTGEDNYWRVTSIKSTPLFTGAYQLGALMGGAPMSHVDLFRRFGFLFGVICQIGDDISDAMDLKLNADWHEARNNLLFMYVEQGDNPYKDEFKALKSNILSPGSLARAQEILVRSGALSYALFVAFEKIAEAEKLIQEMDLADATPIHEHLDLGRQDFEHLLGLTGTDNLHQMAS